MNKRIWGAIIVIIGLLLIAAIIFFLFFYKPSASQPVADRPAATEPRAVSTEPAGTSNPATAEQTAPLPKKTEVNQDDLARMASAFAERFGSFSNQSDYGNVRDLQIFMTNTMKDWSENYINDARSRKIQTAIYYGIVTKAISSTVKQFDADTGLAEILVKTQRRESAGLAGNSSTFYQDIIIKYIREQGVWRVDGFYWQSR